MKVYTLALEYEYEGSTLLGVFTTPEKAKDWLVNEHDPDLSGLVWGPMYSDSPGDQMAIRPGSHNYVIEEWDLDDEAD